MSKVSVLIVGGGWAGLAAAVELSAAGHSVRIFEAAPQLGGRARAAPFSGFTVDNGQHLLIGAYRETLSLLQRIGLDLDEVLCRETMRLDVIRQGGQCKLRAPTLPAPLHLAWALMRAQGISFGERRAALAFCLGAYRQGFRLSADISVAALLAGQPSSLIAALWEPLCLATLNTAIHEASAQVFLRVLRDAFARRRHDSDLLHPRTDLGQLLPQPAQVFIEQHGGSVHTRSRVEALLVNEHAVQGVVVNGNHHQASQVIVATAPWHATPLLQPHPSVQTLGQQLSSLASAPICTLYLHYPPAVSLGHSMLGFAGTTVQWLIDRGLLSGQHGLLAAVISADGPHMDLSADSLAARVMDEIAAEFPHWPRPQSWRLIREKRATFRCRVGIERLRPINATSLPGLWLAGDYTATGYPATLEGAVRSGVQCARQIIQQHG